MTSLQTIGSWRIVDSGVKSAEEQMQIDSDALAMVISPIVNPTLRFFQWPERVISFGYLLHLPQVLSWAKENKVPTIVKRPTGGGAVLHNNFDLNLSLIWPRSLSTFSDHPRTCYAQIHQILQSGLSVFLKQSLTLFSKTDSLCAEEPINENGRFSLCFEEPVCNDVMMDKKKIIGGALRITKQAVLYQGTITLPNGTDIAALQRLLIEAFTPAFTAHMELAAR